MDASWRRNYLRYKSFFLNMLTQYKERSDWKAYLEILLSLFTISVFSVFALRPTILTIAELIQQIEEKEQTVAKMDEKIGMLSKAQTIHDRQRNNISLLNEISVPKRANSDIFARQLEGLSSKHQVEITRISMGEAQILGTGVPSQESSNGPGEAQIQGAPVIFYSLTSTVDVAQYRSILDFIKDFENLRTISRIDTFTLNIEEESETQKKSLILLIEGGLPYLMEPTQTK